MTCLRASEIPFKFFLKSSAGRNEKVLRGFRKFLFFPKTARLKGQEKKSKEMDNRPPGSFCRVCLWISRGLQRKGQERWKGRR